jgi:hypothetical protein
MLNLPHRKDDVPIEIDLQGYWRNEDLENFKLKKE